MAGEANAMMQALLANTDTLPQATLRELADKGVILSVMTFEEHMSPQVHWIEPEEFGKAFDELTKGDISVPDDSKFEAAFTPHGIPYPPFINARRGAGPGTVEITVRSEASQTGHAPDTIPVCGSTSSITLDIQDLDQWVADLQRLRKALD